MLKSKGIYYSSNLPFFLADKTSFSAICFSQCLILPFLRKLGQGFILSY